MHARECSAVWAREAKRGEETAAEEGRGVGGKREEGGNLETGRLFVVEVGGSGGEGVWLRDVYVCVCACVCACVSVEKQQSVCV